MTEDLGYSLWERIGFKTPRSDDKDEIHNNNNIHLRQKSSALRGYLVSP